MTTILVIEDDTNVASAISDVLTGEGFRVLVAEDGEAGFQRVEADQPDLVVLDMLLPKVQGFDLLARIRKSTAGADVPIVVLSAVFKGKTYEEDLKRRFEIAAYLDKPFNADALIDVLHDVFSSAYPEPLVSGSGDLGAQIPELSEAPRRQLDADEPGTVPFKGDLAEISFARVFGALFAARVSGALMLRKGSVKKIVHFQRGMPIFVKSNLLSECLGQIMVSERLITKEQCDASLERKKQTPGIRHGEILVKMGCISPHNLSFALELQLLTKLYDLFSWLEGKFQFSSRAEYPGPLVSIETSPLSLIFEGSSRTMSTERLRRDLSFADAMPIQASDDPTLRYQALQLDARAEPLLDKIDGARTLDDLLALHVFDESDAVLLLHALIATGLLKAVDPFQPLARSEPTSEPLLIHTTEVAALTTGEIDLIARLGVVEPSLPPISVELPRAHPAPPSSPSSLVPGARETPTISPRPQTPAEPVRVAPKSPPPPPPRGPSAFGPPSVEVDAPSSSAILKRNEDKPAPPPPVTPPPPVAIAGDEEATDPPALKEELRLQVRARLEAQASLLGSTRPREAAPVPPPATAPKKPLRATTALRTGLDLDKERLRAEQELSARLGELERRSYYELLGVSRNASSDEIRAAYKAEARKNDPERILGAHPTPAARRTAEQIYLLLTRALNTLTQADSRELYDRRAGYLEVDHSAPPFAAGQAADNGLVALASEDFTRARDYFAEAARLDPSNGVYKAHLSFAMHRLAPDDLDLAQRALEALDQAVATHPRSEAIHVYAGIIHARCNRREEALRAFERALLTNPDCVVALKAIHELEPKPQKKQGLLSRLTLGS